jgi:hypothetical protein
MRRLLAVVAVLASATVTLADRLLVERVDPIDLKWGEASVAAGSGVVLIEESSEEPTKIEYPFVWKVEFVAGRRTNKTPGERADKAVIEEQLQTIGTVLIAASFAGGREQAKLYQRALASEVQRFEMQSVARAFQAPTLMLEGAMAPIEGDARLEYCALSEGFSSSAGLVVKRGVSRESEVGAVTELRCQPLRTSTSDAVEFARFRIGYELLSTVTESVQVAERHQRGQEPIAWPALATKQLRPIAAGEGWFSRVEDSEDGAVSTEALRPTAEQRESGGSPEPSQVLEVRLKHGPLPLPLARGRGSILRFELQRNERTLGPLPHESARDRWAMTVALLLPGTGGALDTEQFVEEIANAAAREAGPLTPETILSQAYNATRSLNQLELITILCPPNRHEETAAKYCIRHVCAKITNAAEFCSELESQFLRN